MSHGWRYTNSFLFRFFFKAFVKSSCQDKLQACETMEASVEKGSTNCWKKDRPTKYGKRRETEVKMDFSFTWIWVLPSLTIRQQLLLLLLSLLALIKGKRSATSRHNQWSKICMLPLFRFRNFLLAPTRYRQGRGGGSTNPPKNFETANN